MTDKPIWEQLAEIGAAWPDDLPQFAPEFAPRWHGDIGGYTADQLRAAVAKERERCAKVCDEAAYVLLSAAALAHGSSSQIMRSKAWAIELCAKAIRQGDVPETDFGDISAHDVHET